jgi:hypothetical protein
MFYASANRDERVFDRSRRFDVTRPLQPQQVGFGAGGPHFCLGANLARREIAVMFDEIRRRLPDLRITGEPDYLQSNFINGIKRSDRDTWLSTLLRLSAAFAIIYAVIGFVSIVSIVLSDEPGPGDFASVMLRVGGVSLAAGLAMTCRTADRATAP